VGLIAALAMAGIAAAPMHASGAAPHYPRITRFPDAAVKARMNARLAKLESDNRAGYRDCLSRLRATHEEPQDDSYWVDIKVGYLSRRYMSLEINSEEYCGGPRPLNGIMSPVTFDLSTAKEIDWKAEFKSGFFSQALNRLYIKHYPWTITDAAQHESSNAAENPDHPSDDCKTMVDEGNNFLTPEDAVFRLRKGRGLVVTPIFTAYVMNCEEEVALPASEMAPYLKDKALLFELRAMRR